MLDTLRSADTCSSSLQMLYAVAQWDWYIKPQCLHLHTTAQQGAIRSSLDGPFEWSPSPSSCLPISLFLHWRRWCLCQAGAQKPHKAREDVTTNKNSIATPWNLIRSHWFMLWMETSTSRVARPKGLWTAWQGPSQFSRRVSCRADVTFRLDSQMIQSSLHSNILC